MPSDKGRRIVLFLSLLGFCLGGAATAAGAGPGKAKEEVRVLDPVGVVGPGEANPSPAPRLKSLSGKTVWVVVVDYGSTLMPAVAKLLPKYAPGVKVKTLASSQGNPFFMLKPEDRPDALIAGTGVCEGTTLDAGNFARQAEKLGIPAVVSFNGELLHAYLEAVHKLHYPGLRAYATALPDPARAGDPEKLAGILIPQLIEGLTRPGNGERPRLAFTGSEAKGSALFETLRWHGGIAVSLPTEARVAALLKGTSRKPSEAVGAMAPGMRQATVEKVAIQAAMAGCTPEQMPVALALAELMIQQKVAEALCHREPPVLQIALSGPAAASLGGESLGKLARLLLVHLAGLPGPALEGKRLWATVSDPGQAGESTVSLREVNRAETWKQATAAVDKWR